MDALFTRWDPIAHLQTEDAQIAYLKECIDDEINNEDAVWETLTDIERSPLLGDFSWSVRLLCEELRELRAEGLPCSAVDAARGVLGVALAGK